MKYFIITVDTEGDDLWHWTPCKVITTKNASCIDRFQCVCEKYNLKPVYLINYEMALSDLLVRTLKDPIQYKNCEIGMHLHAWNSPPEYNLPNRFGGNPYITEYPLKVIYEKHKYLKSLIEDRFDVLPVSYRSGRWATNKELFSVLEELGILVDCSITPQLTHSHMPGMNVTGGSDYTSALLIPHMVGKKLMEVPMTTRCIRNFRGINFKNRLRNLLKGQTFWMRPAIQTVTEMIELITIIENENIDYIEFMIHSSELLEGGSPYCKTTEDIDNYYSKIEQVFSYVVKNGYHGVTLKEYYYQHVDKLQCDLR